MNVSFDHASRGDLLSEFFGCIETLDAMDTIDPDAQAQVDRANAVVKELRVRARAKHDISGLRDAQTADSEVQGAMHRLAARAKARSERTGLLLPGQA